MQRKKTTVGSGNDLPKLAAPAHRALASARVLKLADLTKYTEDDIAALHGMGPNAMAKLKAAMTAAQLKYLKR